MTKAVPTADLMAALRAAMTVVRRADMMAERTEQYWAAPMAALRAVQSD